MEKANDERNGVVEEMTWGQIKNYGDLIKFITLIAMIAGGVWHTAYKMSAIDTKVEHLQSELTQFKQPGGRFTSDRGARLEQRLDDLEKSFREFSPNRFEKEFDAFRSDVSREFGILRSEIRDNRKFLE